jgi:hypothetical protein
VCILSVFTSVYNAVQLCAECTRVQGVTSKSLLCWKVLLRTDSLVMISFVLLSVQGHACCDRTGTDLLPWVGHVCVAECRLRSACWIVEQTLTTLTRQDALPWTSHLSKAVPVWFRWGHNVPHVSVTVGPWLTNSIHSWGLVVTQVGRKSRLFFP